MEGLIQYYMALSVCLAAAAVLAVLWIREYCRRRDLENTMKERIREAKSRVDVDAGIYERLFPASLLKLLGIKQYSDISTEVARDFMSAVVAVNVLDYTKAIHTMDSERLFSSVNGAFARLIPVISQSGGVIDHFERSALTGLYGEQCEAALTASISLCEIMDEQEGTIQYDGFGIGMDYGEVRMGIVGHEARLSVVTMSENVSLAEMLQKMAVKYGARILATARFCQRIPDFDKLFNSRRLGYFYDTMRESMIEVFDIYDGDPPERRQNKRRTRMIFEQGVDRYVHGRYEDARLHFVEVLKADRYDLAAREYLYLCDTFCSGADKNINICIEKF